MHPVDSLRIIKTQAAQHKVHTGKDLDYNQYLSLLLSAAQQHDKTLLSSNRNPRRRIYDHELDFEAEEETYDAFSIDSSVDFLSVNQSISKPTQPVRMSKEQWYKLTDEAKQTWDKLDDASKSIILGRFATPKPSLNHKPSGHKSLHKLPLPRHRVHNHEIDHLLSCLSDGVSINNHDVVDNACLHAQSEGSISEYDTPTQ